MIDRRDWSRGIVPGTFTIAGSGVTIVTATGTAVALRASQLVANVTVKARSANAGTVYLGAAGVTNDEAALTGGLQLDPGDMVTFPVTDLAAVFVNGTASDGVSYAWWT